jgi:hypothetical protein
VDESVRHLQDSFFQVSLGREGAVPVWVGMGRLETKSGEPPNPNTRLPDTVDQTPWLISLVAQSSLPLHTNIRKNATAN